MVCRWNFFSIHGRVNSNPLIYMVLYETVLPISTRQFSDKEQLQTELNYLLENKRREIFRYKWSRIYSLNRHATAAKGVFEWNEFAVVPEKPQLFNEPSKMKNHQSVADFYQIPCHPISIFSGKTQQRSRSNLQPSSRRRNDIPLIRYAIEK